MKAAESWAILTPVSRTRASPWSARATVDGGSSGGGGGGVSISDQRRQHPGGEGDPRQGGVDVPRPAEEDADDVDDEEGERAVQQEPVSVDGALGLLSHDAAP